MKGAGGTEGGIGQFFIGLLMMCTGGYMFLESIVVKSGFAMSRSLYRMPMYGIEQFNVTGGMILIPFIFGVGFIFYHNWARMPPSLVGG